MDKDNFLTTEDNFRIAYKVFEPQNKNNTKGVILINSATGVKKEFYKKFAQYFSENGFYVYTYDYRGIGKSRPKSLRGFKAKMIDWGRQDLTAMIRYIKKEHQNQKLGVLGHSFGGQSIAMTPKYQECDWAVLVASPTAYWKHWGKGLNFVYWVSHVIIPASTKICGFFPARTIGGGENLPKGVALEWAKWCRSKNYLFDYISKEELEQYGNLKIPIYSLSFTDDSYAPLKSVKALLAFYSNAKISKKHITPKEVNMDKIGHFGFFREQSKEIFWTDVLNWINDLE